MLIEKKFPAEPVEHHRPPFPRQGIGLSECSRTRSTGNALGSDHHSSTPTAQGPGTQRCWWGPVARGKNASLSRSASTKDDRDVRLRSCPKAPGRREAHFDRELLQEPFQKNTPSYRDLDHRHLRDGGGILWTEEPRAYERCGGVYLGGGTQLSSREKRMKIKCSTVRARRPVILNTSFPLAPASSLLRCSGGVRV